MAGPDGAFESGNPGAVAVEIAATSGKVAITGAAAEAPGGVVIAGAAAGLGGVEAGVGVGSAATIAGGAVTREDIGAGSAALSPAGMPGVVELEAGRLASGAGLCPPAEVEGMFRGCSALGTSQIKARTATTAVVVAALPRGLLIHANIALPPLNTAR